MVIDVVDLLVVTFHLTDIQWRTEVSADEDLSHVVPMDTGGNIADWTKEPEPMVSSPASSNWADFSSFGQTEYVLLHGAFIFIYTLLVLHVFNTD